MGPAVVAFLVSLALASILLPVIAAVLRSRQLVDIPNHRSSHSTPTLRGAGLALAPSALVALLVVSVPWAGVIALVGCTVIGALDDWRRRPAATRLLLQVAVGVIAGLAYQYAGAGQSIPWLAVIAIFVLSLTLCVNTINFMDGINGITAIHGVIFGGAYAWICWNADLDAWVPAGLALVGISLAFMPWNLGHTARMFLGDSGSYLFGALTGSLVAVVCIAGPGVLVAVGPVLIYLTDVLGTLAIRVWRRKSLFDAHRDHAYQRLILRGWSHSSSTVFVAACSAGTALLAVALANGTLSTGPYVVLVLMIAAFYFVSRKLFFRSTQLAG